MSFPAAKSMISVDEALSIIREQALLLDCETVPLTSADGRVLAEPITSAINLPPFDNSAMDGFALYVAKNCDVGGQFEVIGELAAGDDQSLLDDPRSDVAISIMTGAALPACFNSIAPIEQVLQIGSNAQQAQQIQLLQEVIAGQHVRRAGEDITIGEQVLDAGHRLDAAALMVLRGIGCANVSVRKKPRVAIVCTGRELVDVDGADLFAGQIYNTNGPYLQNFLQHAGADVVELKTIADDKQHYQRLIERWIEDDMDIVVSTGAVSMGRYDFVPEVLAEIGAQLYFHKVKMRPGKPQAFARLPGGSLFFGLPGNPISSAVGARFFVSAALRQMVGMPVETPVGAALRSSVKKKSDFTLIQKARLVLSDHGVAGVDLLPGQESFKTGPLLHANVWAFLSADVDMIESGQCVDLYPLQQQQNWFQPK